MGMEVKESRRPPQRSRRAKEDLGKVGKLEDMHAMELKDLNDESLHRWRQKQ
jgi:hypothetical protein